MSGDDPIEFKQPALRLDRDPTPEELAQFSRSRGPDVEADARALAKILSRGGYSYQTSKQLVKRGRELAGLKRDRDRHGSVERLTEEEQERFVEAAYQADGVRGLMMQTLLLTGLRVSEFVALRIEDLSFAERSLEVESGKGGKRRSVRLPVELAQALRLHVAGRIAGPLFVSRQGGAYGVRRVQQLVKQIADEAEIQRRVHPHLLRHTYAMMLRRRGVAVDVVADVLGHESIETTRHYYGKDPAHVAAEIDKAFPRP